MTAGDADRIAEAEANGTTMTAAPAPAPAETSAPKGDAWVGPAPVAPPGGWDSLVVI